MHSAKNVPNIIGRAHWFVPDSWTCSRVAQVIAVRLGVSDHPDPVWRLLRSLGYTCRKPEQQARERGEAAVATWCREDWPRIKKSRGDSTR